MKTGVMLSLVTEKQKFGGQIKNYEYEKYIDHNHTFAGNDFIVGNFG